MGKGFRHVNVCLAGDFGPKADKMKQWIEAHGGTFSRELHERVTHLITTQNSYRKKISIVQDAKKMKKVKIVSADWLEESLVHNKGRPKREVPYLFTLSKAAKRVALEREKVRAQERSSGDARAAVKKDTGIPDGYHGFKDTSGLIHSAFLVRPTGVLNKKEKYSLQIFESDTTPHSYGTHIKYSRVGISARQYLAPLGSTWEAAFGAFEKFFKAKSGKRWSERGQEIGVKKDKLGTGLPAHGGWFEYQVDNTG